jgi:enterochelin esterase-like enzyme
MATQRIDIADPGRGIPSGTTYVLLPPGYSEPANAARRYPVVYLLHGYPYGGPLDWLTAGDAPATLRLLYHDRAIAPMIVVSVDLTAGEPSRDWEGLDVPRGPRLETYFADTVVREIDRHYRTIPDRSARALGGMSGGGFAALNIGLHQLGKIGVLLITLPYDALGDDAALLGGDQRLREANTPRDYLPTMAFPYPVSAILAAGAGAPTDITTAHHIADALHTRGQNAVVHIEHGFNHTWHTARATLPYLLVFADQLFPRGQ